MNDYHPLPISTPDFRTTLAAHDHPDSLVEQRPAGTTRRARDAASHARDAAWRRSHPQVRASSLPAGTNLFKRTDATTEVVQQRLRAATTHGPVPAPVKPPLLQELYDRYEASPTSAPPPDHEVLVPLMQGSDPAVLARMPSAWLQTEPIARTWLTNIDADRLRSRIVDCCPHLLRHPEVDAYNYKNGHTRELLELIEMKLGSCDVVLDIPPDRLTPASLCATLYTLGYHAKKYVTRHGVQIRRLKLTEEEKSHIAVQLRNHASCAAARKILRTWPLPSDPWPTRAGKTIRNLFHRLFSRHS